MPTAPADGAATDAAPRTGWPVWLDRLRFAVFTLVIVVALVAVEVLGLVILDLLR